MKLPDPIKEKITQAFHNSDTGRKFFDDLERNGWHVFMGTKNRVCIIRNGEEKIYPLARIIPDAKTADIRDKMKDMRLPTLEEARQKV